MPGRVGLCCGLVLLFSLGLVPYAYGEGPLLRAGDRVAVLGGTFVERMQASGHLEAELQCRRPDWTLSFRNLGWSGDDVHGIARKRFDGPADGFKRLLADIETADPTVVLVAYGFSEASDGEPAVNRFEQGLRKLIAEVAKDDRRVILLPPVPFSGFRVEDYQASMQRCRQIVGSVGRETKTPVVELNWVPSPGEMTEDQLLPSSLGYQKFAQSVADQLVGGEPCQGDHVDLREKIAEKNQLFFHRYRPQNETYLFLFRKHEQGNNAVEIPQFDPLIKQADQAIWGLATSK